MIEPEIDPRLEERLRTTLQAVARTTPRSIAPYRRAPRPRRGRAALVAAAVVAVAGVAASLAVARHRDQAGPGSGAGVATSPATSQAAVSGSLLATPLAHDVRPYVTLDQPGWRAVNLPAGFGWSGHPTAGCPGCTASRLVLVSGTDALGGAVFTAWIVDAVYDVTQLDTPVAIGAIDGRANVRAAPAGVAQNRVTLAWPLADGRTAFVDATGMPTDQVVEIAAALHVDEPVPTVDPLPAGWRSVPAGGAASVALRVDAFTDDRGRSMQIVATNQGIHGLLDWAASFEHLMVNPASTVEAGGTTVLADHAAWWPAGRFGAYWIAGDWGYRAVGAGFASQAEFLDALASLQLTSSTDPGPGLFVTPMTQYEGFSYATGWVAGDAS